MTSAPPFREESVLLKAIVPFERSLREIKRRWYYLSAFEHHLERASRGKPFSVVNSIAYQMALDSYHMLVIDLNAWILRQRERAGLFPLMRSRLGSLTRKLPTHRRDGPNGHLFRFDTEEHSKAFELLFPGLSPETPLDADVDALEKRVWAQCERVNRDRNINRAHAHQRRQGRADWVGVAELGEVFEFLEKLLSAVRLIADFSCTSYDDMNATDVVEAAQEWVDQVLIGLPYRRRLVMQDPKTQANEYDDDGPTLDRDDYYARLHAVHDARDVNAPEKLFNDCMLRDV